MTSEIRRLNRHQGIWHMLIRDCLPHQGVWHIPGVSSAWKDFTLVSSYWGFGNILDIKERGKVENFTINESEYLFK